MDNLASCATAESIFSAAVLTYPDLKAGAIYKDVTVASTLLEITLNTHRLE